MNWSSIKTTVAGLVVFVFGAAFVFAGYWYGKGELAAVGVGMLPIAYGFLSAKDNDVTGGTIAATVEAESRIDSGPSTKKEA